MADSNLTKRALANALKELMLEQPFEKIGIRDICDRCDMNRKSFYYHFKDKYDLFNWCFDTEFIECVNLAEKVHSQGEEHWELVERACSYFYENRVIFRNALKVKGQNSFSEHFREFCFPILKMRIAILLGDDVADDFAANFFADAAICSIERWLTDKNCILADEFVFKLKRLIYGGAVRIYQELEENK